MSIKFNNYYKLNNIITVSMPTHSSHLLQLLNIGIFSSLKATYGHQINLFIQASINHITKSEFFVAYLITHNKIFIKKISKKLSEEQTFYFKI